MSAQSFMQLQLVSNPILDAHYVCKQHAMANNQIRLNQLLTNLTSFGNKRNPNVHLILFHNVGM